ncbi:MAG TPA: hypothetical protein VKA21_01580, partial [Candidatus Binatia bacterium]|nr:hypothetical protein [Candidatus Binatia bacterium]
HAVALGGHFVERSTRLRYDTRVADVAAGRLVRSFACHWYWVVATAWTDNPWVGEVVADGGADHAVKIWDAHGRGSTRCRPGQFLPADGAIAMLPEINGWITSLAFSPDGRFLAGASRDRAIRIWQVEPGPAQWRVVALWWDEGARNFTSVAWSPDGRALATGDRSGRVAVWGFDPVADRWDDATIEAFARVWYQAQPSWFRRNASLTVRTPLWSDGGHGTVWTVRWSPDGTRLAASGADGRVAVYDAGTGTSLVRFAAPWTHAFHGLDWTRDGRLVTAGGADGRIYLFEPTSGALYDVLEGHADVVTAVGWSPDGRTLASTAGGPLLSAELAHTATGPDQTLRFWTWR